MLTFLDLQKCGDNRQLRLQFVERAISEHIHSPEYKTAEIAELYFKHLNPDIAAVEKFIYDLRGMAHKDVINPNHKLGNNRYYAIITESVSYLLGNGVSFNNNNVKDRLGSDFDDILMDILTDAENSGVSYGYFDGDKLMKFAFKEFKAIPDDYTSEIRAGVRFTQIDKQKPLMAILYEEDGYTEYKQELDEEGNPKPLEQVSEKRPYETKMYKDEYGVYSESVYQYSTLPIYPLYNRNNQSEIVGNRETLAALDLMQSQLINNTAQGEFIYWILKNFGGMDDVADSNFIINTLKSHIIHIDDDGEAIPHQMTVPVQASESSIAMLNDKLNDDMMSMQSKTLRAGNVTATEIKQAYAPLRLKTSAIESNVRRFIKGILNIAGIDTKEAFSFQYDEPINKAEELQLMVQAAQYLSEDVVTRQICTILGLIDEYNEIQKQKSADDLSAVKVVEDDAQEIISGISDDENTPVDSEQIP